MKKKHFAIVGRIPFDDEDSCYCIEATTEQKAINKFMKCIIADSEFKNMRACIKQHDSAPFVNIILQSDTPILCKSFQ